MPIRERLHTLFQRLRPVFVATSTNVRFQAARLSFFDAFKRLTGVCMLVKHRWKHTPPLNQMDTIIVVQPPIKRTVLFILNTVVSDGPVRSQVLMPLIESCPALLISNKCKVQCKGNAV